MWRNSTKDDQFEGLAPPEMQGWKKNDSEEYTIDWEDDEMLMKIQSNIDFLTKGCTCKAGCQTKRCGCKKNGNYCGAGCER